MTDSVNTSKEQQLSRRNKVKLMRALLPIAGLIIMFVLFNFLTDGRLIKHLPLALSQIYVIMIASMGVFFIMNMGGLDFSQGSILGLSAIVICMLSHYSIPLAIAGGIATGAAIGAVNGFFYVRLKIKSFIVTICTMFLFRGLIKFLTTEAPVGGSSSLIMMDTTTFKVVCTAIVIVIGYVCYVHTKFGTYLKAIGAGEMAARFAGIRTDLVKFMVYVLSGAITGFAAFMSAIKVGSVTSSGGNQLEIQILIALVLGGMPISGGAMCRFGCCVVGSLLYVILTSGLTMMGFSTQMMQLIQGVIFLTFVFIFADRKTLQVIK